MIIRVDSRVRLPLSGLTEPAADAIRAAFTHDNPQWGQKANEPQVYRTWKHEGDDLTVPRGGMARVREALRAAGVPWSVDDARTWQHPAPGFPDHLRVERAYQTRMREAGEKRENCLLHGACGSGKTTVLYSLLSRLKRRSLVMVWTGGLLRQWRERAQEELGLTPDQIGIIQGGKERIEPLTLCMQQTITSRFKRGDFSLCDQFDIFLYDEVQRAPAVTSFAAIDPFSARYRIGVSADSRRKDQKQFLTADLFGGVAEEITEAETIAAGATVDVEIYVVPTNFRVPLYYVTNPRMYTKLIDRMVEDEDRNELALKIAKKVVGQGEQVLIFTHRVEHARTLDSRLVGLGIRSGVLLGGKENELAFERAAAGFKSGDHRAGVGTYQAVAQAIDLPSVSRGICMTPISSNEQTVGQVRGRICRGADGKSFGRIYYLLDPIYGRKPVRNFVSWGLTVRVWDGRAWVDGKEWLGGRHRQVA